MVSRAEALLGQIQTDLQGNGTGDSGSQPSSGTNVPAGSNVVVDQELVQKARETVEALTVQIQSSTTAADESKLERLLGLCDRLNGGIDALSSRLARRSRLRGLGLKVDGLHGPGVDVGAGTNEGTTEPSDRDGENTPRVDKGKGRAEPQPEEHEKVLSPTFMISESEDEDENRYLDVEEGDEVLQATSPTDRCVVARVQKGVGMRMLTLIFVGRRAGWRKRVRYSARARCCLVLRRWRGSTRAKSFGVRYVSVPVLVSIPLKVTTPSSHSSSKQWSNARPRVALSTNLGWRWVSNLGGTMKSLPRPHLHLRPRPCTRIRLHFGTHRHQHLRHRCHQLRRGGERFRS